ncbi:phosphodiester glycosidase family protein [Sphingobacterium paucimobilis]|uniref:Phosphodiester glycosidase domain-containing protein n=1 Tax=Sphingobacterium paucimobilis HER1398 TaxID=1346330 RepID=U2HAF4_9SPHI|nr:phosphodiester glycosidase family protein [Sphingobacterium paucimobilis]ERJ58721.1 hypothetical protein M472_08065 [Sphingobacterium paucimobilis HER1398]
MKRFSYILWLGTVLFFYSCSNKENYIEPYEKFEAKASTAIGQKLVDGTDLIARVYKDSTYQIVPGLDATEFNYLSTKGYPMKLFVFEVDLLQKDISIEVSTAHNSVSYGRQKMTEQAVLRDYTGHKVWAGTNGDFFDGDTGVPQGVLHKEGVVLKSTFASSVNTFFGITDQGKAVIGNEALYTSVKNDLVEALGGRVTLLSAGIIPTTTAPVEPRTAVGVSEDGNTVYMLVVDGRRYHYSNGMDYLDLGKCFKAMGAYNAINLDGGGSSTFFVRNTPAFEDNRFEMRNWPWDNGGEQRSVSNGLLVVSKVN